MLLTFNIISRMSVVFSIIFWWRLVSINIIVNTVGGGRAMDRADILNAIREINRTEEATAGVVSTSISRMQELGVQRGVARYECFAGSRRCFINQQRTGTVSRRVLTEILKMRSEHLWTCSTCNDDDRTTN